MDKMRIRLIAVFSWVVLIAVLWGAGAWFTVSAQSGPQAQKLDACLRAAMQSPGGIRTWARTLGMRDGATPQSVVSVLVKVSDDGSGLMAMLASHGGRMTSRTSHILAVRLPWSELVALADEPTVTWVESCPVHQPSMDVAVGSTGTNVQALLAASPRFTGKGVLVGIIDTGIDTTNPAFRDSSGHSRVDYLWDSTVAGPGPSVPLPDGTTFAPGYGKEFTNTDLDNNPTLGVDTNGHGTHVAGCSAGRDTTYPGIAPEAHLLIVRSNLNNAMDAYTYLVARATAMNLPLVVNYSAGSQLGPHDGSSTSEQFLQQAIDDPSYPLRTCIAAGNSQADGLHVQDQIPAAGSSVVALGMTQQKTGIVSPTEMVDIWYPAGAQASVTLVQRSPAQPTVDLASVTINFGVTTPAPVDFMTLGPSPVPTGTKVNVVQETPNPQNGDNHVFLVFSQPNAGDTSIFVMTLQNATATASRVDYYNVPGTGNRFLTAATIPGVTQGPTPQGTVESPSTTPGAISVGAYTTKNRWTDSTGTVRSFPAWVLEQLAAFSSIGPVRNASRYSGTNVSKPDIAAPGQSIASQRSTGATYDVDEILDSRHVMMQGTSMACPITTGVVALMLQENPIMTASDVKAKLFAYARGDAFTTATLPNPNYGWGKVDAEAANHIQSAPPRLQAAQPTTSSLWNLQGLYFASSAQVLVNGVLLPDSSVFWNNHKSIDITLVSSLARVQTITVRNPNAAPGSTDSTLTLDGVSTSTSTSTGGSSASGGGGGCFIATAAYGSYLHPHVMVLRNFRDRWLLTNRPGTAFVNLYYRVSPPVAQVIEGSPALRFGARILLTPVVYGVEYPAAGFTVFFLVVATPVAWRARRRAQRRAALAA